MKNKEHILKLVGYAIVLNLLISIFFHIQEVFYYSSGWFLISIHTCIALIILWIGIYLMTIKK